MWDLLQALYSWLYRDKRRELKKPQIYQKKVLKQLKKFQKSRLKLLSGPNIIQWIHKAASAEVTEEHFQSTAYMRHDSWLHSNSYFTIETTPKTRQVSLMENISMPNGSLCLHILSHNCQICFLGIKNKDSPGLVATIQLIQVTHHVTRSIFMLAHITSLTVLVYVQNKI